MIIFVKHVRAATMPYFGQGTLHGPVYDPCDLSRSVYCAVRHCILKNSKCQIIVSWLGAFARTLSRPVKRLTTREALDGTPGNIFSAHFIHGFSVILVYFEGLLRPWHLHWAPNQIISPHLHSSVSFPLHPKYPSLQTLSSSSKLQEEEAKLGFRISFIRVETLKRDCEDFELITWVSVLVIILINPHDFYP